MTTEESSKITFNYLKHTSQHPVRRWMINNFYRALIKNLIDLKIATILDAGCGEGFTLNKLMQSKIGKTLIGIDNSFTAINLGKKLFPHLDLRINDIYSLSFKENSKDLVICVEVLEHLKNPEKALSELVRVSKKYLILSVPNEPFFSLKNLLIGRNIIRCGSSKGHINWWTSLAFKRFVKQEKVKVIKSKYPFPFTLLLLEKRWL